MCFQLPNARGREPRVDYGGRNPGLERQRRVRNSNEALTRLSRRWSSAFHWSRLADGSAVCCAPHGATPSAAPEPSVAQTSRGEGGQETYIYNESETAPRGGGTKKGKQCDRITRVYTITHTSAHVDIEGHVGIERTHTRARMLTRTHRCKHTADRCWAQSETRVIGNGAWHTHGKYDEHRHQNKNTSSCMERCTIKQTPQSGWLCLRELPRQSPDPG